MRHLQLRPGETAIISLSIGDYREEIKITAKSGSRPGPRCHPTTSIKSKSIHPNILNLLEGGPMRGDAIHHALIKTIPTLPRNVTSWALVELQNLKCQRSKTPDFLGPVVNREGDYHLRD